MSMRAGHLLIHSDSVTEEQIRQGDLLYLAMGKSHKTSECCLTQTNFIDRAALFFDKKVKNPAMMDLDYVLCQMVHTGKYSIHGSFFTEHGAIHYQRAQAAFCARITPTATTPAYIHTMIFTRRSKRDMMRDDILEKLERDAPGSHDPFASADAHVSLSPNRCECAVSAGRRKTGVFSPTGLRVTKGPTREFGAIALRRIRKTPTLRPCTPLSRAHVKP